jgi:hypothetical protein
MVELNADGLGALETDAATLAAWEEATELQDKAVVDVNGFTLGRVTRCFAEEGALVRCDVTLDEQAKRVLGATRDVVGLPPQWIAGVAGGRVRLRKAGEEVVGNAPPPQDTHAAGAPELPRKER